MEFIKNFNNNAALVKDESDCEWVVVGNGIGFGKQTGQPIDIDKIEHRYKAANEQSTEVKTLTQIAPEILAVVSQIIQYAEGQLAVNFDDYQYLILADHLDFAVQRAKQHIEMLDGTIRWEISKMYPKEYQVAQRAAQIVEEVLQIKLTTGEDIFLTYHFVNATSDVDDLQNTIHTTKLISHIVDITQYLYGMTLDTQSFSYNRFISHLHLFIVRHINQEEIHQDDLDPSFLALVQTKYPEAYQTVQRINQYLIQKEQWNLYADEQVYLAMHILRVTNREQ